jgi:DNA-binding IclR family transcriptional regulator
MAEKKKRPSTARARAVKPTDDKVVAPMAIASPAVAAVAEEAPAEVALAGLEVDARPVIRMPAPPPVVTHTMIAGRANELYRTRGGSAFDNWIQAERELSGQ